MSWQRFKSFYVNKLHTHAPLPLQPIRVSYFANYDFAFATAAVN